MPLLAFKHFSQVRLNVTTFKLLIIPPTVFIYMSCHRGKTQSPQCGCSYGTCLPPTFHCDVWIYQKLVWWNILSLESQNTTTAWTYKGRIQPYHSIKMRKSDSRQSLASSTPQRLIKKETHLSNHWKYVSFVVSECQLLESRNKNWGLTSGWQALHMWPEKQQMWRLRHSVIDGHEAITKNFVCSPFNLNMHPK